LLQIWILPERQGLEPSYEQRRFEEDDRRGRLRLVASQDGRDGSVTLHQDAEILAGLLDEGDRVEHELRPGRGAWIQLVRGRLRVGTEELEEGDGAAVDNLPRVELSGLEDSEVLLFDLG
jgi:redox-sensitive bicupin YhaK (pirin superfamily)